MAKEMRQHKTSNAPVRFFLWGAQLYPRMNISLAFFELTSVSLENILVDLLPDA
jgi:hypothetical protein